LGILGNKPSMCTNVVLQTQNPHRERKRIYLLNLLHSIPFYADPSLESCKNNCDQVIEAFLEWLSFTQRRAIVLKKKDSDEFLVLEYRHRWKKSYVKQVKKKLEMAMTFYLDYDFIHLVLTVPRENNIPYYMERLKKAWKNLHDKLTKEHGYFPYVTVIEPQRDGYPHLHVLMFCNWRLFDKRTKKELNNYLKDKGIGEVCYAKRYWAKSYGARPLRYLLKYLGKYWNKEDWKNDRRFLLFFAFLWLSRTRTITMSRGFWFVKPKPTTHMWELFIVCDIDELGNYLYPGSKIIDEWILEKISKEAT